MRKRQVRLTAQVLEEAEPNEPLELEAARFNIRQLTNELIQLRAEYEHLADAWNSEREANEELQRRIDEREARLDQIARSHSWRITAPLRSLRNGLGQLPTRDRAAKGSPTRNPSGRSLDGN